MVTSDMLILVEGDRIPADGVLLSSNNVSVDEALLNGESVPVRKISWTAGVHTERLGGDDQPVVYSGTLVMQGAGSCRGKINWHPDRNGEDRHRASDG
ncbi:MAG: hypothetical protein WC295_13230 [Methanoregula sp.]